MPYGNNTSLPVGICSDGTNFQVRARDCNGIVQEQTVARNGNSISATFNNFKFNVGACCTGTLQIDGVIGPQDNFVYVTLIGSNISPNGCTGGSESYYGTTGFQVGPIKLDLGDNRCAPRDSLGI